MTIELKTGKKGELHISSEDDRLLHCRSFGTGTYVLSGCTVTMTSVNKAHIAEGELMVQGGYVRITGGGEDVAISNGVAGQKRNTIIALEYTRDSNGIEAMSFVSVDGASTTETPSDPTVTTNNINTGASSSSWKFARIQLDGLTVGTPQILFTTKTAALLDQISSLSSQVTSLQDSVDQIKVEQRGTSGIWEYAKYSNGIAECWGIDYTGSFNINTLWGNGFYISDNIAARNYPFTFKSAPREFAQITLVNPANHNTVYTGIKSLQAVNSTSKTCAYQMLRSGSGTGFAAKIEYYVRGEWK